MSKKTVLVETVNKEKQLTKHKFEDVDLNFHNGDLVVLDTKDGSIIAVFSDWTRIEQKINE